MPARVGSSSHTPSQLQLPSIAAAAQNSGAKSVWTRFCESFNLFGGKSLKGRVTVQAKQEKSLFAIVLDAIFSLFGRNVSQKVALKSVPGAHDVKPSKEYNGDAVISLDAADAASQSYASPSHSPVLSSSSQGGDRSRSVSPQLRDPVSPKLRADYLNFLKSVDAEAQRKADDLFERDAAAELERIRKTGRRGIPRTAPAALSRATPALRPHGAGPGPEEHEYVSVPRSPVEHGYVPVPHSRKLLPYEVSEPVVPCPIGLSESHFAWASETFGLSAHDIMSGDPMRRYAIFKAYHQIHPK